MSFLFLICRSFSQQHKRAAQRGSFVFSVTTKQSLICIVDFKLNNRILRFQFAEDLNCFLKINLQFFGHLIDAGDHDLSRSLLTQNKVAHAVPKCVPVFPIIVRKAKTCFQLTVNIVNVYAI